MPSWFYMGSTTPRIHVKNVWAGRHPLGNELGPEASRCRTCKHLIKDPYHSKTFYKCEKSNITHGAATDVKLKWRGCVLWEQGQ